MGQSTSIEWTEATWNPIRGCSRVSEGCRNCYAERQAIRHAGAGGSYEGLVKITNGHPQWTGKVNAMCGDLPRSEVVELARLCSHPLYRDLTRVGLRLWRIIAPGCWSRDYWQVNALVSYSNNARHTGDIYRFDGWTKVQEVKGGKAGVNTGWTRPRKSYEAKSVWVFNLAPRSGVPRETTDVSRGKRAAES